MVTPEDVARYIKEGMVCDYLSVIGDGTHFEATIVAEAFRGKTRIQQHKVVYAALGNHMHATIHALAMKTYTPEDWAKLTPLELHK